MKWTETNIARALALQTFARKHLVLVPNCTWTGYECDLLIVTPDLRIIDVEVKISRADLKADAKKDKWWIRNGWGSYVDGKHVRPPSTPREWPLKVWKHYYAMPKDIWKPELADSLPSSKSGIILLTQPDQVLSPGHVWAQVERRATPDRDAKKISPKAAIDIARLASLRMWESYRLLDEARAQKYIPAEAFA
jgi:hypothetical protein